MQQQSHVRSLGRTFDGYLSCVPKPYQCDICSQSFQCDCKGIVKSQAPLFSCPNHPETTQHEDCLNTLRDGLRELCLQNEREEHSFDHKSYDGRFGSFREPLSKPNIQSLASAYLEKRKVFSIFDNCQIPYLRHTLLKLSPCHLRLFASYRCVDKYLSMDSRQLDFQWLMQHSLEHLESMIVMHPSRLNLDDDPDFAQFAHSGDEKRQICPSASGSIGTT